MESMVIVEIFWYGRRVFLTGHIGFKGSWLVDDFDQPHEASTLRLDCSKTRSILNWLPRLDLTQSIELTAIRYKAYANNDNMHQLTEQQILAFIEMETT